MVEASTTSADSHMIREVWTIVGENIEGQCVSPMSSHTGLVGEVVQQPHCVVMVHPLFTPAYPTESLNDGVESTGEIIKHASHSSSSSSPGERGIFTGGIS